MGIYYPSPRPVLRLSSHICSDIGRICSEMANLHKGRIAVRGRIDELKERVRRVGPLGCAHGADVPVCIGNRNRLHNWRWHDPSQVVRVGDASLEDLFLDVAA